MKIPKTLPKAPYSGRQLAAIASVADVDIATARRFAVGLPMKPRTKARIVDAIAALEKSEWKLSVST